TAALVAAASLVACADGGAPGVDTADTADAVRTERAAELTWVRRVHDRVVDGAAGPGLEVTIMADGAGRPRRVGVHASIDGGPWADVAAVRIADRNAATDVWAATITPPAGFATIEYVVWAEADGGDRRWDSHDGANYRTPSRRTVAWAGHHLDGDALVVDLDVDNLAYDKRCDVVFTTDDWMRSQYAASTGRYVGATGRAGIERWQVRVEPSSSAGVALGRAAAIEYAVACSFGGTSTPSWDNNLGGNFRFERARPPVPAWSTPFAAALDVEVAPDGTVFALSTSDPPAGAAPGSRRWITVYGPDGAWRGVVTLPADAERLTFVAAADVLIAEVWAPDAAQVRRLAVRRDGSVAWDRTGPRGWITVAGDAAFLIGGGEIARLGDAAPVAVACAEPTVAPSGIAACAGADATRVVDVDGGAEVATLPAGEPYAISDDGQIVVVGAGAAMAGGYTTSLTAYRLDGTVAWRQDGLMAPPDHGWGGPRVLGDCTNHVIADVLGFVDQPATGASVVLLDVATGAARRRVAIEGGVVQACPAEDGRFHWNQSYMRYGRWSDALDPADDGAAIEHLDVGFNGTIGGLVPGGRTAYVQTTYLGAGGEPPQPRLVIAEPGGERWSDYQVVPAGAGAPLIDAAGAHAVVYVDGALTRLDL
ncbi:MAG: hypothetical protein KC464_00370, partial [Myxococcales bacterium]|nr:hypothetical protein [Myxococcales bacterium]